MKTDLIAKAIIKMRKTRKRLEKEKALHLLGLKFKTDEERKFLCDYFDAVMCPLVNYKLTDKNEKIQSLFDEVDKAPVTSNPDEFDLYAFTAGLKAARTELLKIDFVRKHMIRSSEWDRIIIRSIVCRSLECGVTKDTVNKSIDYVNIYTHNYMRCDLYTEKTSSKIVFPALSQIKMDGAYTDCVIYPDRVEWLTRTGHIKDTYAYDARDHRLLVDYRQHVMDESVPRVLSGEMLVLDEEGNVRERAEGNGILNREEIDPSTLLFVVWDCLTLEEHRAGRSVTPYIERLKLARDIIENVPSTKLIATRIVNNKEEIGAHFKEVRAQGEEGTVIKNRDMIWQDGTSSEQLKFKPVADADVKIAGGVIATRGKYKGKISSAIVESSCGRMRCNIIPRGQEMVDYVTENIDSIVARGDVYAVKYTDCVKGKDFDKDGIYVLSNPRFAEKNPSARTDKTEADSLERILAGVDMAVEGQL